jgi:hypothetical protein
MGSEMLLGEYTPDAGLELGASSMFVPAMNSFEETVEPEERGFEDDMCEDGAVRSSDTWAWMVCERSGSPSSSMVTCGLDMRGSDAKSKGRVIL